ncbi:hypothetical protein H0W91_00830 [Patescibacteria group bacterium]|nr:hypothetical protein [Patescibacteria group bacterium]
MKLDRDIKEMSLSERGKELQRLRNLLRTHKARENNARCWMADITLYDSALPEGSKGTGQMNLPRETLLRNCANYIDRQKC